MKLSHFQFNLPEELLAEFPTENRDESRLMVVNRKTGTIEHKFFKDVIDYFDDGDVMVLNNTKVFPARLYGNKEKTGARIEVFLLRELNAEQRLWDVLVDPARKIRIGNKLYFGDDDSLVAEVIDNTTSRGRTLRFLYDGSYEEFRQKLVELGETPIPKYINREVTPEDAERYQTIYAKVEGAVAAPTAGMHFSKHLLKRLEIKGIDFAEVTLHVGLGTFNPVEVEDLSKHKMDSEEIIVGAASILAKVRRDKEIEKISDLLNLDVGSGYPSDPKTKEAVKKLVNSKTPNQYLRWSWATVKNAWNSTHDLPIPIREEFGRTRIQSSLNEWSNTEM